MQYQYEPSHDKTNKMAYAPSEDSDQPGHFPSLIRVFAVRVKQAWVLSYPLSAQADLSLHWAHSHFVGSVMKWLISLITSLFACWRCFPFYKTNVKMWKIIYYSFVLFAHTKSLPGIKVF